MTHNAWVFGEYLEPGFRLSGYIIQILPPAVDIRVIKSRKLVDHCISVNVPHEPKSGLDPIGRTFLSVIT